MLFFSSLALCARLLLVLALTALSLWSLAVSHDNHEVADMFLLTFFVLGFISVPVILTSAGKQETSQTVGYEPATQKYINLLLQVCVCWVVVPLGAAVPFTASLSYAQAYFEAASALTTTGATVFDFPEDHAPSLIIWRALLQWGGGLGVLLTALTLLVPRGISMPWLRMLESPHQSVTQIFEASPLSTGTTVTMVYILLSFGVVALSWAGGLSFFHAVCFGFAAISTGGMVPTSTPLFWLNAPLASGVLGVSMFLGACHFPLLVAMARGRFVAFFKDKEVRIFVVWLLALSGLVAVGRLAFTSLHDFDMAFVGSLLFDTVSLVTTTGFSSGGVPHDTLQYGVQYGAHYVSQWPLAVVLVAVLVGGMSLSTTGGIRVARMVMLFHLCREELARLSSPNRVFSFSSLKDSATPSPFAPFLCFSFFCLFSPP